MVGSCADDIGPGLMPTAIAWLFRGIGEQKNKTGARFSVRVSAVEVAGPAEVLRDLLAPHATGKWAVGQPESIKLDKSTPNLKTWPTKVWIYPIKHC